MAQILVRLRCLLLGSMLLTACTGPLVQQPAAAPSPMLPTSTPLVAPPSVESPSSMWQPIYTRPGFNPSGSVDVRAVGDLMLGRSVGPVVRKQAADWLFAPTALLLRGDLVLGNLESPLTLRQRPEQLRPGPFRLPADPALVGSLAPFTALSLANNHALDAQEQGLIETRQTLEAAKIVPLGLQGTACPAAPFPTSGPIVLAFNDVRDPQDQPTDPAACGRAWLDQSALDRIAQAQATEQTVIVLVHWGEEYAPQPSKRQRTLARELVAAGADLVLGSHPHVVQPTELIEINGRRGFVAYSLGNTVFDQADQPRTSHSVILRAQIDADGVGAVAAVPIAIRNGQPIPLPMTDPAAQSQLTALQLLPIVPPAAQTPLPTTPQAWRWDGTTFVPIAVPPNTVLPPPLATAQVDLRGNGEPLTVTVGAGMARLFEGARPVWSNEATTWHIAGIHPGDFDNDGRFEVLLRLWKPDDNGVLRSHPFLLGWRGGYYRVFWGGSAVAAPIQAAAIGSVNGPRNALVVLGGGQKPGDPADHISVWTWQGWNFQEQWHSPPGVFRELGLIDLDGDQQPEIVAK